METKPDKWLLRVPEKQLADSRAGGQLLSGGQQHPGDTSDPHHTQFEAFF